MSRVVLVRHAQTIIDPDRPSPEWDLDPAGLELLRTMAQLPVYSGVRQVLSSTEPKAIKTGEVIVQAHGLPAIETFPELREVRKGGFVGNHDEVVARLFAHPEEPPAAGWETGAGALERFRTCLDRLVAETPEGDLMVVSHGNVLALYLAWLQGQERVDFHTWRSIGFPDVAVVDHRNREIVQPFGAWHGP